MLIPTKDTDIQLSMVIYTGDRGRERHSTQVEASIHYESNRLVLSVNAHKQKDNTKDITHLLCGEFDRADICVQHAEIVGKKIGLKFGDKKLCFKSARMIHKEFILSAELSQLIFTGNEEHTNRFRLTATANDLQEYINTFDHQNWREVICPREIEYRGKKYVLSHDNERVWVETAEENITDILILISFFYAAPVECDIEIVNGITTIRKTEWNLGEGAWKNPALDQLYTECECYSRFWEYIALVNTGLPIPKQTETYMREFIRSHQLDRESKLIIDCAILANMADVSIGEDSYTKIADFLANNHHIVAKKIDGDLEERRIKKTDTEIVTNFYGLRNFFEHQLGSDEARTYLKESRLLERLEVAINIVILHQLGVEDVRFDSKFKKNSLCDDSVPLGRVYEHLFNMAKKG